MQKEDRGRGGSDLISRALWLPDHGKESMDLVSFLSCLRGELAAGGESGSHSSLGSKGKEAKCKSKIFVLERTP